MAGLNSPRIAARPFRVENAKAIPRSGRDPEAIWHFAFDVKTYTSAATTTLNFFDSTNVGNDFLSNMELPGQFPAPQVFDIHGIFCDMWAPAAGVSTNAATLGNLNDIMLLMFVGNPIWLLTFQQKKYGPYPLSTLHGTNSPVSALSQTVAAVSQQQATNDSRGPGWSYNGSITIPANTAFQFNVRWQAAQTLTANWLIRIGLSGKLSRAVK